DSIESEKKIGGVPIQTIRNSRWYVWLLIFGSISAFFLLALHFNSFPIPMQIAILGLAVLGCYGSGLILKGKRPIIAYILVGIGSAVMLGLGVLLLEWYGSKDPMLFIAYVA